MSALSHTPALPTPAADAPGSTGIAVLAGGRSRRLAGEPKACLPVGGRPLLLRVLDAIAPLSLPAWVVRAATPPPPLVQLLDGTDLPQLVDRYPDAGPLGGLATALAATDCRRILLLACDLPFLRADFLRWLLRHRPGAQAVVPRDGGRLQPLCAVYDRAILPDLIERIAAGHLRVRDFLTRLDDLCVLPRQAWRGEDDGVHLLANVNTADALAQARRWADRRAD